MYSYSMDMNVRDYECDLQGIVNNAVYQNYLEHTRHEFILSKGLDFAKLHNEGIDAVVCRAEIDYRIPLTSGDAFISCLNISREGKLRIIFHQKIFRKKDDALIVTAKIFAVCLEKGRPIPLDNVLKPLIPIMIA